MHSERAADPTTLTRVCAVVFDLDGTLVDARAAVVDAVAAGMEEVLRHRGIENVHPDKRAIAQAMGLPAGEYFRAVVPARLQYLAGEVQTASTHHEVQALTRGEGRLYPGVVDLLAGLRAAGLRLAVISNAQAAYFDAALRALELAPRIDHRECHGDLPAAAPTGKAALLARALAALGVPAARACMVGDRHDDLEAGLQIGCVTMAATWGFGSPEELSTADFRLERPLDVLRLLRPPLAAGQSPVG